MFTNLAILGAPSCRGVSANGDCRSLGSQKKPKPSCAEGLLLTSWNPFSTARYPVVPVRGGFTTMKIEAAIPGGKRTYRSEGSPNGGCSGQIRRLPTHFWTYTEGQQTISWSGSNDSWLSCNYICFFDVETSYNYNCLSHSIPWNIFCWWFHYKLSILGYPHGNPYISTISCRMSLGIWCSEEQLQSLHRSSQFVPSSGPLAAASVSTFPNGGHQHTPNAHSNGVLEPLGKIRLAIIVYQRHEQSTLFTPSDS